MTESASFARIAMAVAPIFLARGYAAVSLRQLASELGIKPASLYYHCPGGKAELYLRSLEVHLRDYQQRLERAPGRARFPNDILRMADWMLENPSVDLQHIFRVDLPQLEECAAERLVAALHDAVISPFAAAFEAARSQGELRRQVNPDLAAAAAIAIVEGLGFSHLPGGGTPSPDELDAARRTVRSGLLMLLDGVRRQGES
jgi:AcrR family transcriptional regulator